MTLLRPNGVGIMIVCDTQWTTAQRPLDDLTSLLAQQGFSFEIELAPASVWAAEDEATLVADVPGLTAAQVVGLVFRAPAAR